MTHIITMTYTPTAEARSLYDSLKNKGQRLLLMNAGSLEEEAKSDEWISKNIVFERSLPDNKAELNTHWSEMTSVYAVWKNLLSDADENEYIQNSHYRRMLDLPEKLEKGVLYVAEPFPMLFKSGEKPEDIIQTNIEGGMRICHPPQSWEAMEQTMYDLLNWHDIHLWNEWKQMNFLPAPNNLFAMPVWALRSYCPLVFPVLDKIESMLPFEDENYKTAYQRRATGFCAERLFSFWCYVQNERGMRFQFCPVKKFEDFKPITDIEERNTKL